MRTHAEQIEALRAEVKDLERDAIWKIQHEFPKMTRFEDARDALEAINAQIRERRARIKKLEESPSSSDVLARIKTMPDLMREFLALEDAEQMYEDIDTSELYDLCMDGLRGYKSYSDVEILSAFNDYLSSYMPEDAPQEERDQDASDRVLNRITLKKLGLA